MGDIDLKRVVLETLDRLTNQTIAERLGTSQRSVIQIKKGSPVRVNFFKTIEFIESILEKNEFVIVRKTN